MRKNGYYWMAVTADEYEEPLVVAESSAELARMLNVHQGTVLSSEARHRSGRKTGRKIIKVPFCNTGTGAETKPVQGGNPYTGTANRSNHNKTPAESIISLLSAGYKKEDKTMDQKKAAVEDIKGRLEAVSEEISTIIQCMEVLSECIYHMTERKDKDLSKSCAAAAEAITGMIYSCQDKIVDIAWEL